MLIATRLDQVIFMKAGSHLRIDGFVDGLLSQQLLCTHKCSPNCGLPTASRTKKEDTPPNTKDLP